MELQSKARHLPFMTAYARLVDRYKIVLDDDTFIERAYWIWRSIGNIAGETKVAYINVSSDLIVTLPQDCEFIQSLTTTDFQDDRNYGGSFGDYSFNAKGRQSEVRPDPATTSVEANARVSDSTVAGERLNYKTFPGHLQLTSPLMAGKSATLVYKSIVVGEDGLPLLNDPEVEAIVVTMALREAEQSLFGGQPNSAELVAYLTTQSEKLLAGAKSSDEKISDDALDKLLDIKTSWGRKCYGSRLNLI
jgi:hypothetical protein